MYRNIENHKKHQTRILETR